MSVSEKRTSIFANGLIWFGAGVSIAEILTGTYFAPLGFSKGLLAILIGHVIGCVMLFLAGYIGAQTRKSAMETAKMSFGNKGGLLFSILNVLQLVGWTAIMIYDGALAANGVLHTGAWIWCLVIGVLIILWILIGITNLGKINTVAMAALFVLTLVLCKVIFFDAGGIAMAPNDSLSFGAAVELAVAMPLSWAAFDQRLHQGGGEAFCRHHDQHGGLWNSQYLDVCHRHGSGDFYRRIRYRTDHG